MADYATRAEFEAYVEGWNTTDTAALDRLLARASRDLDRILVGTPPPATIDALKYEPATLPGGERAQLARAACAQAEYRLHMGEDFFVRSQATSTSGPEFSEQGKRPRIGPKVWEEMRGSRICPVGRRAR